MIEAHVQLAIDDTQPAQGNIHALLPDGAVLGIARLELHQFGFAGIARGRAAAAFLLRFALRVHLLIKTQQLADRVCRQRRLVAEVLPAIEHHAELRAPVADVIIRDDAMPKEPRHARQTVADDGAADVADVHLLRHIGCGEINHDGLRLRRAHAELFIRQERPYACREGIGRHGEIDKPRPRHRRLLRHAGDFDLLRQFRSQRARVQLEMLRQQHRRIGLVVAKARIRRRRDLRHKSIRQRMAERGQRRIHPLLQYIWNRHKGAHSGGVLPPRNSIAARPRIAG